MNRKTILTGIAAFATTMAFGLTTQAADYRYVGGGGNSNWNNQANWYLLPSSGINNGYPDGTDDAAIFDGSAGVTLTQDELVGHMEVISGATVTLSASSTRKTLDLTAGAEDGKLIIDSNASSVLQLDSFVTMAFNSAVTHENGNILKLTSQTNDAFIEVNADVTFGPYSGVYGSITGEDDGAKILIADGMELINQITVRGRMEIAPQPAGTATFTNFRVASDTASGRVLADVAGTLKLAADVIVQDDSDSPGSYLPAWRVNANGAELQFNEPAGSLIGNFSDVGCVATLRFNAAVTTSGSLSTHTGRIWAVSFQFQASNYDSTGVSQPDTACP